MAVLKTLYNCFVRSKLEYCSLIWSPIYNKHIGELESVQRKFLKYLYFKTEGVYPPRGICQQELLTRFEVDSLYIRRCKIAVTFLYKLLHNMIDCSSLLAQV